MSGNQSQPKGSIHQTTAPMKIKDLREILSQESKRFMMDFPYSSVLSFDALLAQWDALKDEENPLLRNIGMAITQEVETREGIRGDIRDLSIVEKNMDFVESIMPGLFPMTRMDTILASVFVPFDPRTIWMTPAFETMLEKGVDLANACDMDIETMSRYKLLNACLLILQKVYGYDDLDMPSPMAYNFTDPDTGLTEHYKAMISPEYLEVAIINGEEAPVVRREDVDRLLRNIEDVDGWLELLPPDRFEFRGLGIFELTDVSQEDTLSRLTYDLLENTDLLEESKIRKLEQGIRDYLQIQDLTLGLVAMDPDSPKTLHENRAWHSLIANCPSSRQCSSSMNNIFDTMLKSGEPYMVEDLADIAYPNTVESSLLERGVRNVIIAPLMRNEDMIGFMELTSNTPSRINSLKMLELRDLLPILGTAMERTIENWQNEIQKTIRKQFTAIHPVVEWKFTESAREFLDSRTRGEVTDMPAIRFREVFPIYGQSDIQSSSVQRNHAVQEDLSAQLKMAGEVIKASLKVRPLPILEEVAFRLDKHRKRIKRRLVASDESQIQDFLRLEVEPLFKHLDETQPEIRAVLADYRSQLDAETGFVTTQRHRYEESLTRLNEHISSQLEQQQQEAQSIFPHYFEKYKTDGVEYNAYIGESLVRDKFFDPIYLRNLRLWQLNGMAQIALENEKLSHNLPIPLKTTQLILVHSTPLDIRFRMDEKRFDVDGAYNIRYEIIKKRIDKAVDVDTGKRITQHGKIVIVFDQARDMKDYRRYIEFLQDRGLLKDSIEELTLEPMQGVQGMRALRVSINFDALSNGQADKEGVSLEELLEGSADLSKDKE